MKSVFTSCLLLTCLLHLPNAQVSPSLSPSSEVLDIVNGLGNNEGATLPKFSVRFPAGVAPGTYPDFEHRGPGIRDYSRKWVYSKTRQRAFYAGGGHNTERWNDLWEYDLASNTWVMVLEPDPANTGRTAMHTWASFTYDQNQEKVYWMPFTFDGSGKGFSEFDAYGGTSWVTNHSNESLFSPSGAQALDYCADRDISIYFSAQYNNAGMWRFNANTQTWTQLMTHSQVGSFLSAEACAPYGMCSGYDIGTGQLIHFSHEKVYHYNFDTNTWTHEASGPFTMRSERTALTYDTRNKVHIIHSQNVLYAYHAGTRQVEILNPAGVALNTTAETMFFYHEGLRVIVCYTDRNEHIWVYRYKTSASVNGTAPADTEAPSVLEASPNPFNPAVRISVTGAGASGKKAGRQLSTPALQVTIYDPRGRTIDQIPIDENRAIWNARNFPSGIYLARVTWENRAMTKKLYLMK
jgi:hypothetical protein